MYCWCPLEDSSPISWRLTWNVSRCLQVCVCQKCVSMHVRLGCTYNLCLTHGAFIFTSTVYEATSRMSQCTSRRDLGVPNHLCVCKGAQVCTRRVYETTSAMSRCMSWQVLSVPNHLYVCQGAHMCIRRVYETTSAMSQCVSRQVFRVPNHLYVCKGAQVCTHRVYETTSCTGTLSHVPRQAYLYLTNLQVCLRTDGAVLLWIEQVLPRTWETLRICSRRSRRRAQMGLWAGSIRFCSICSMLTVQWWSGISMIGWGEIAVWLCWCQCEMMFSWSAWLSAWKQAFQARDTWMNDRVLVVREHWQCDCDLHERCTHTRCQEWRDMSAWTWTEVDTSIMDAG